MRLGGGASSPGGFFLVASINFGAVATLQGVVRGKLYACSRISASEPLPQLRDGSDVSNGSGWPSYFRSAHQRTLLSVGMSQPGQE
jgi:hypothetical protein